MKIKKNKDKRCPIGMDSSQKETVNNILVNIVDVTKDEPGINSQVYDQNNPCNDLYPPDKA